MSFHMTEAGGDPENSGEMMRRMFGPQAVDNAIRQAISTCWMVLPDEKRTAEIVEAEIRRLVDRALANFRDDAKTFLDGT